MKKILMCIGLFAAFFYGNAQNLVRNGDFKEGGKFWTKTGWTKNAGTVEVKDGTVCITQTDPGQYTMYETGIALKPKTRYTVSFQIKCDDMKTDGNRQNGAGLLILHNGATFLELSPKGKWSFADGSFDWKSCSETFSTDQREGRFMLYLRVRGGVGKAFFADVRIEEQPEAVQTGASVELQPLIWQNNVFHLAAGFPGCIYADLRMAPPKGALAFTLDLPKGIALVGASPWRWNPAQDGHILSDKITSAPSPEKGFTRYTVSPDPKYASMLQQNSLVWRNYYRFFLLADTPSEGGTASLKISVDGKQVSKDSSFLLKVLPELKMPGEKLESFKLHICYLFSLNAPTPAIRDACMNFWLGLAEKPSAFNVFGFASYPEEIRNTVNDRFDTMLFIGASRSTPLGFTEWGKKKGISFGKIVLANGKQAEGVCPSVLEDASNPVWNDFLPELIAGNLRYLRKDSPVVWDFEPGAKDYCFCEVCRKKFSDSVRAGKLLAADEITRQYPSQWFDFRVKQNTLILKAFSRSVRRHFPKNPVWLCTDPLHSGEPHVAEWCGVDVREVDNGEFDCFMNMPYYEGITWYDDLAFNRKTLKTPDFPLIDPTEDMEMFYKRYTPEGVFMNMVAAAALGAKGIGFWPGDNFDARYLHIIADASGLIARAQEFYAAERCGSLARVTPENVMKMEIADGTLRKTVSFPNFDSTLRYAIHRKGDRLLATIFNYNPENRLIVRLAFPGVKSARNVTCLNDDTGFPDADPEKGFLAEIPANAVRLFELSPDIRKAVRLVTQTEMRQRLEDDRKRLAGVQLFKGETKGKDSASWGLLPGISAPLVKLSSGDRGVYIHPSENASVVGFFIDRLEDILADSSRGLLDDAKIYGYGGPLNYRTTALTVGRDGPSAAFTAVIPVPENADPNSTSPYGLMITKKVFLENNGTLLRSVYTLENPAGNTRRIAAGLRIRHYPRLGAAWKTGKPLSSFWTISFDNGNARTDFRGSGSPNHIFLRKDISNIPDNLPGPIQSVRFAPGPVMLRAANGRQSASLSCSLILSSNFAGFFSWWSASGPSTLEPMSVVKTLNGGEKMQITSLVTVGK